eukprot:15453565-Alexandrium_andersonii.AAC.1
MRAPTERPRPPKSEGTDMEPWACCAASARRSGLDLQAGAPHPFWCVLSAGLQPCRLVAEGSDPRLRWRAFSPADW